MLSDPHPAGQRFSAPIRRYFKPGLKWVISITRHAYFYGSDITKRKRGLKFNSAQLNQKCLLPPKHSKVQRYQDECSMVLSLGIALSPEEKERNLLHDTVRAITKVCTKCIAPRSTIMCLLWQ